MSNNSLLAISCLGLLAVIIFFYTDLKRLKKNRINDSSSSEIIYIKNIIITWGIIILSVLIFIFLVYKLVK